MNKEVKQIDAFEEHQLRLHISIAEHSENSKQLLEVNQKVLDEAERLIR